MGAHSPAKAHRAIGARAASPFPPVFIPGVKRFWGAIALKWRLLQVAGIVVAVPLWFWVYDFFGSSAGAYNPDTGQMGFDTTWGAAGATMVVGGALLTHLLWIEYDERETNRKRANIVFAILMAVIALGGYRNLKARRNPHG